MSENDPRLPMTFPYYTFGQQVVSIIRDGGPLQNKDILSKCPATVTSPFLTYVLKNLRQYGITQNMRKGSLSRYVWVFIPVGGFATPDEPAAKLRLLHANAYRVRTKDGKQFDRMTFDREEMEWSDRYATLTVAEIDSVAFIPEHSMFKAGVKHLDAYAYKFVSLDDCIIPKRAEVDTKLPQWINPIRARLLGVEPRDAGYTREYRPLKKDFGSPHK